MPEVAPQVKKDAAVIDRALSSIATNRATHRELQEALDRLVVAATPKEEKP